MARRAELLKELETVTLANCELTRMGSPNDAGYVMCKNLLDGIETAYSYGIGWDDKWGCDVSVAHKVRCISTTALRRRSCSARAACSS